MCISYVSRSCEIIPHQTILSVGAGKRWPRAGRTKRSAEHRTWPKTPGFRNGCNDQPNLSCNSLSHLMKYWMKYWMKSQHFPWHLSIAFSTFSLVASSGHFPFPLFPPFSLRFPEAAYVLRSSDLAFQPKSPANLSYLALEPICFTSEWNLGGSRTSRNLGI